MLRGSARLPLLAVTAVSLALVASSTQAVTAAPSAPPAPTAPTTSAASSASAPAATDDQRRRRTKFGMAFQAAGGKSYHQTRKQMDRRFGRLDVIRYFHPGAPGPWSNTRRNVGKRPIVISFKIHPDQINNGSHDASLRTWFRQAPERRRTWYSYQPEPEDDIESHQYTGREYRRAWHRIHRLERSAHNRRLHSTLSLMCWTLNPLSNRRFKTYYPGRKVIDVLSWDCYNWAHDRGYYAAPRTIFGKAIRKSNRMNDGFGVAETGSPLVGPDPRRHRARWLHRLGRYLKQHHAVFATYFHVKTGPDYRLKDRRSARAWRHWIVR